MQEIMQFVVCHPILSAGWMGLLIATLYTIYIEVVFKVKIITCSEVTYLINKEDAVIVDLRQRNDFQKGHITGAINLSETEIRNKNVGKLDKYINKPIVVVDYNGVKGYEAALTLKKIGFNKIFMLKEGIFGWERENLPIVNGTFKEINNE